MKDTTNISPRDFIIRLGLVSLFADFTYEGSHAIVGLFLAQLSVSPLLAGLIAGMGEMTSAIARLVSGHRVDKTRHYWRTMSVGYASNLLAIPLLATVTSVFPAALLIFAERFGKGIRGPARNVIIADAAETLGAGRAFGLHARFDQLGAFLGPLAVAGIVALSNYRWAFAFLLLPGILSLAMLYRAHAGAPTPQRHPTTALTLRFSPLFFRYVLFGVFTIMGLMHFILLSYHLILTRTLAAPWIPVFYACAMAISGLVATPAGLLFDRLGLKALYALPLLILALNPLLFLTQSLVSLGVAAILWGTALGVQAGMLRAGLSPLMPASRRGAGYGLFDTATGLATLLGSATIGYLSPSPHHVLWFTSAVEFIAIALLASLTLSAKPGRSRTP